MNMTTKGRTVFRRECELTGTKSVWCSDQFADQALIEVTSGAQGCIKLEMAQARENGKAQANERDRLR
jgi:hypothetical protein